MVSRLHEFALVLAVGGIGLIGLEASPAGATLTSSQASPHIVARPNNLMINTNTMLTGTGFKPRSNLTVEECSTKTWIAPQNPCATSNVIHVRTNQAGYFKHAMTAKVCPSNGPPHAQGSNRPSHPQGFAQRCYVGVPTGRGVDEIVLVGATPITVTGP